MGAQWDRAGGRARVPRIADLAPFVMRQPPLFLPGLLVLVAWARIGSRLLGFFSSHWPLLSCMQYSQSSSHHLNTTSTSNFTHLRTHERTITSTCSLCTSLMRYFLSYFVPL